MNRNANTATNFVSFFNKKSLTQAIIAATAVVSLTACNQNVSVSKTDEQKPQTSSTQTATATVASASSMTVTASAALPASATATTVTTANVSQQFTGDSAIERRLREALPTIQYSTDNLNAQALTTNSAGNQYARVSSATAQTPIPTASSGTATTNVDKQQARNTRVQALLNWQHFSVGAVDGKWGKNTVKAMQAFQKDRGIPVTNQVNEQTWQALLQDANLAQQPALVNYTLTEADINTPLIKIPKDIEAQAELKNMGYESLTEALAEKFHMDEQYLKQLNKNANFAVGETITVFNPGQPSITPVTRLVADRKNQQLFAYDAQDQLVAVYPTTVGSTDTPTPSGKHQVVNRILKPNYTYSPKNSDKKTVVQPGPNTPVGIVWIGLDKDGYGIHGSPDPEAISRQASHGCVRLTNWDVLSLYGTIDDKAVVEFI